MSAIINHLEGTEFQKSRAFSPAVEVGGGKTVYLAGQTATKDVDGNDISYQFEAQVKTIFALMGKTLARSGGTIDSLVWMTVFINDPRYGDEFVKLRGGIFAHGRYPASALITVSQFARPGILIEIQGIGAV